jgi:hypothetical protein
VLLVPKQMPSWFWTWEFPLVGTSVWSWPATNNGQQPVQVFESGYVKHQGNNLPTSDARKLQELKWEILDLKITNRGKDYLIGEFSKQRKSFFEQLLAANRAMGQLEARLNQLDAPELK